MKALLDLLTERFGPLARGVELRDLTTWRIGGRSAALALPTEQAAADAIGFLDDQGIDRFVLGRGSNVLASDSGYGGVVLLPGGDLETVSWLRGSEGCEVRAGAASSLPRLAGAACMRGAAGLGFAIGIPGTVGGAVCMNAGAYGSSLGDLVTEVTALGPRGSATVLGQQDCFFDYRSSRFQGSGMVITSVCLSLAPAPPGSLRAEAVAILRKRRESFPLRSPSAGSVFRRPLGGPPPGFLIERAGLKGTRLGGAVVSQIHANFIVNDGGATSSDVAGLIRIVRDAVRKEFDVVLTEEIVYLGPPGPA